MTPYNRFYKCVHFELHELVDPVTLKTLGDACWSLFDPYLLSTMDRIRERYGVVIISNNWKLNGPYKFRGFRPSDCKEGAELSSHRRGTACDFDVYGKTAEEVRRDILDNKEHIDFMFINRIELGVSWVHIDVINVPTRIQTFSKAVASLGGNS